jgi:hypothetical protein
MAGMPTVQHGDANYLWICSLFGEDCNSSTPINHRVYPKAVIEIHPNPAVNTAVVRFKDKNEKFVACQLVDSHGILMKTWRIDYDSTRINALEISLEGISPGFYCIIVRTDKTIHTTRFLKLGNIGVTNL